MLRGEFTPFFQESCFRVQSSLSSDARKPRTRVTADEQYIIPLILAKSGYFNSNPEVVMNTPIDIVMQTYHYEMFCRQYEETSYELNKEKK